MIIKILDDLIAQAELSGWIIKYVAFSSTLMKALVLETKAFIGADFEVETLTKFKDVPLKVKDIVGFQVAYDIEIK